ncbi:tandem-95 repeat protein [Eionea flava]
MFIKSADSLPLSSIVAARVEEVIGDVYIIRQQSQANKGGELVKPGDDIYLDDILLTEASSAALVRASDHRALITLHPSTNIQFSPPFMDQLGSSYNSTAFTADDEEKEGEDSLLDKLLSQEEDIQAILPATSAPYAREGNETISTLNNRPGLVLIWERVGSEILPVKGHLQSEEDTLLFDIPPPNNFFTTETNNLFLVPQEENITAVDTPAVMSLQAKADILIISEDSGVNNGNVSSNDSSGATPLIYSLATGSDVSNGSLSFNNDGSYSYTPNNNFSGVDSFVYQVTDAKGNVSTAQVNITVLAVADLATVSQTESHNEDTILTSTVSSGNSTSSGGVLTYSLVVAPTNGVLSSLIDINSGNYSYTPNTNFNGVDSFQYLVTDSASGESAIQTVTINITPQNDLPTGTDNSATINEDISHIFVSADFGFSDVDGDAFQAVRIDTLPASGTLLLSGVALVANQVVNISDINSGNLEFVPNSNDSGSPYTDFMFSVQDSHGAFDDSTNTFTMNVLPVNDAPTSVDKTLIIDEDSSYTLLVSDFAFTDVEGDGFANVRIDTLPLAGQLTLSGVAVIASQTISLALIASGELVFSPAENGNGVGYGGFTFSVGDSGGAFDSVPNTITFDVTPVADIPQAGDDNYDVIVNTSFSSTLANGVLVNDTDADGDTITVDTTPVSNVANGTLTLNADGTFTYTPDTDFNGVDSFVYEINDGTGNTTQATVNIDVDYVSNILIGTSGADNLVGAAASDDDIYSGGVNAGAENVQGVGGTTSEAQSAHVGSGNDRLIFGADAAFVSDASTLGEDGGLIRIRDFTVGDVTTDPDADTLVLGDFLRAGDPSFDGTAADAVRFLHFADVFGPRAQLLYIDRDGGLGEAGDASRALSNPSVYHGIDGGASLLLEFKGIAYDATPSGEVLNTEAHIQSLMDLGYLDFS